MLDTHEIRHLNNNLLSLCRELRNKDVLSLLSQSWFFSDQIFSWQSIHQLKKALFFSDAQGSLALYNTPSPQHTVRSNTEWCSLHKVAFHIFLGTIQFWNDQNTDWPVLTFSSVADMVCKIQRLQQSHNLPAAFTEQFLNYLYFIL